MNRAFSAVVAAALLGIGVWTPAGGAQAQPREIGSPLHELNIELPRVVLPNTGPLFGAPQNTAPLSTQEQAALQSAVDSINAAIKTGNEGAIKAAVAKEVAANPDIATNIVGAVTGQNPIWAPTVAGAAAGADPTAAVAIFTVAANAASGEISQIASAVEQAVPGVTKQITAATTQLQTAQGGNTGNPGNPGNTGNTGNNGPPTVPPTPASQH